MDVIRNKVKPFHKYISPFCLLLLGCTNPEAKTGTEAVSTSVSVSVATKEVKDYRQVPEFIRRYLDSLEGGRFLIANPDESWSAGCTRLDEEPDKQLISAAISVDTFKIRFWQGGIAKMERNIVLLLKGEKVKASYGHFSN